VSAETQESLPCALRACYSSSSPDSLPLSAQTVHPSIQYSLVKKSEVTGLIQNKEVTGLIQNNGGAATLEEQVTEQTSLYACCNARHMPPRGV
jgi:hypothetical protein